MQVSFTDSERVLLRQAQYACRGKAGHGPITVLLILDHGRAAAAIAQDLGLGERLWKFLRQKIINTPFYRTKGAFKTAVLSFFTRLEEFGPALASLMNLHFRIMDSQITS